MGVSLTKTIQLLGHPHDYGNPQIVKGNKFEPMFSLPESGCFLSKTVLWLWLQICNNNRIGSVVYFRDKKHGGEVAWRINSEPYPLIGMEQLCMILWSQKAAAILYHQSDIPLYFVVGYLCIPRMGRLFRHDKTICDTQMLIKRRLTGKRLTIPFLAV